MKTKMFGKRTPRSPRKAPEKPAEPQEPVVIKTPPVRPFVRADKTRTPPTAPRPVQTAPTPPRPAPTPPVRPAAPVVAPQREPRTGGRGLVVGRDITLTGEVSDCERLLDDGTLNGEVSDTERLEIAESGRFSGTAVVGECTVAGVIEGDLTVRGLLSIRKGGRVRGTIRYGDVEIARGGRLVGRIETAGVREAGDASARNRAAEGARTTPSGTDLQPA